MKQGHGHVTPNANGTKARCGGPGICLQCSAEKVGKVASNERRDTIYAEMIKALSDAVKLGDFGITDGASKFRFTELIERAKAAMP